MLLLEPGYCLIRPALVLGCIVLSGGVAGQYVLSSVLAGFVARLLVYLQHCTVSVRGSIG